MAPALSEVNHSPVRGTSAPHSDALLPSPSLCFVQPSFTLFPFVTPAILLHVLENPMASLVSSGQGSGWLDLSIPSHQPPPLGLLCLVQQRYLPAPLSAAGLRRARPSTACATPHALVSSMYSCHRSTLNRPIIQAFSVLSGRRLARLTFRKLH